MNSPNLKIFRIYGLRKKLLFYFFLVFFITLSMGMDFIYEIGTDRFIHEISESIVSQLPEHGKNQIDMSRVAHVLKRLQYRLMIIMTIVLLFVITILIFYIRNIVQPLNEMAKVTKLMADGDLGVTVPIRANDEIGTIGHLINDLAVNLQEILLEVWNSTSHSMALLGQIDNTAASQIWKNVPERLENAVELMRQDIRKMQEMVKTFDLYDICLEDGRIRAGRHFEDEEIRNAERPANKDDQNNQ